MLGNLKNNYVNYLNTTVRNSGTVISPIIEEELTRQLKLVKKTTTLQQLATVTTVPSWFTGSGFSGIHPLEGAPETHLKFDFMSSQTGWVGLYGQTKNYRLTFGLARNTLTPGGTSIMSFFGGIGWKDSTGHENWAPFKILFTNTPPYFSQTDKSITTTIDENNWFEINSDFLFSGKVTILNGPTCTFKASPNINAVYNGKKGCVPICFGGVGTSYWSFTDLKLEIDIVQPRGYSMSETGLGWFDHQWISPGVPRGLINQILFGLETNGKRKVGLKWIWLAMQKTNDLVTSTEQYQGTIVIDHVVKKGDVLKASFIHYVNGKVEDYTKQGTVTITDFVEGYPVILHLKIGDDEFDMSPLGDAVNTVLLLNDTKNWEGPATVMNGSEKWGVGFLEVNNMKPGNTGIEDVLKSQNLISEPLIFPQYISYYILVLIISIVLIISSVIAVIFGVKYIKKLGKR